MRIVYLAAFALLLTAVACQADKAGARCDGFFTNTCKSPLSCVDTKDAKFCAKSCDTGLKCKDPNGCCDDGFACRMVSVNGPNGPLPAGRYCLPK